MTTVESFVSTYAFAVKVVRLDALFFFVPVDFDSFTLVACCNSVLSKSRSRKNADGTYLWCLRYRGNRGCSRLRDGWLSMGLLSIIIIQGSTQNLCWSRRERVFGRSQAGRRTRGTWVSRAWPRGDEFRHLGYPCISNIGQDSMQYLGLSNAFGLRTKTFN